LAIIEGYQLWKKLIAVDVVSLIWWFGNYNTSLLIIN